MNSTSENNYISDERSVCENAEQDKSTDFLLTASAKNEFSPNVSKLLDVSPVKGLIECASSPVKGESVTYIKSGKDDDSGGLTSDCSMTVNEESSAEPKSISNLTDSVDSDKNDLSASDVVLVEDDKSTEIIQNPDSLNKKLLEISSNSDVHIIDTPEKIVDSKSLNDSVQIVTPDPNTPIILSDNDVSKPTANSDSFKKIVLEDSEKFISPVYADSKSHSKLIHESRPTYSTPKEVKTCKIDHEGTCTESLLELPPLYKKIGIYVELSAAIHMNKDTWTGEMTNISFDLISNEPVQSRLSDSSGHMGDESKSVSPASSVSLPQLQLKPSRISMTSSSSSSSGLSSASTLARKLYDSKFLNKSKKDDIKLSEEYITVLHEKWTNSNEMYNKFLAFIDKNILNAESITNDDSLKDKSVEEAPKLVKEIKEPLPKIQEVITPVSTNKTRQTRGKRQAKVKTATDSESENPKKRRRAENVELPVISSKFNPGESVFAKWGDRKFYAATLGERTPDRKWNVNFFDGDKKYLLDEFLIKAGDYTMIGSNVYASQGGDNFTPGIITGFEVKNGVLHYIVVRDKGDISVPCQFIYITESQARQIRAKLTTTRTSTKPNENVMVSPGNKRSTRSKTKQMLDSPKPSVSGTQKTVSSDSDDDEKDDGSEINVQEVPGVEPESQGVYENGIKLKGKTLTGKMRFAKTNKANDADANILGPVPEEGSKYFKNFHVLLTCTRPQSPKLQVRDGSNLGSSSESENYVFSTIPFVKDRLKLQLQMGGATVYNKFDDIPQKLWKNSYLISNRPNTSATYIQCLAAGIKVLCHEWVIRCCVEKKKLQLQELPLGWSLELKRYFNSYDRKSTNTLKKLNLLITDTGDKTFVKFWIKVCKLGDINVTKLMRDSNLEQVTAIISDSGYRDENIERALSYNIPVVTTTWLIQTLLHGEPRLFDGHKSYLTEYVESE